MESKGFRGQIYADLMRNRPSLANTFDAHLHLLDVEEDLDLAMAMAGRRDLHVIKLRCRMLKVHHERHITLTARLVLINVCCA